MATATQDRGEPAADQDVGAEPAAATAPSGPKRGFRPDVDALRAVGILLVIGYHGHARGFDGGFVGVDVFFVISGFLITRNLLAEGDRSGKVALRQFWARRLRRLVPAMTVMVAATMLVGMVVLPPLRWAELAAQGTTSTLYVSNLHFIDQSNAYFGSDVGTSPLLHTWSLSVEEQFYVVWPLLIAVAALVGRRLRRGRDAPMVLALVVLGAWSYRLSTRLVDANDVTAFYGLASRFWEFAAAGLLAVAAARSRFRLPAPAAWVLALGGLGLIAGACLGFDEATAFPGRNALLPVVGTLAFIAAGTWSRSTWRLATRPAQWIGRISYSWYLWHWPAMVLAVAWWDADTATVRLLAGLASLPVAMASYRFVEQPVRSHRRLVASLPRTAAVAVAFTLVAVGTAAGVQLRQHQVQSHGKYAKLAAAFDKDFMDGCTWSKVADEDVCTVGDARSDTTILVAGDSHAMSWTPGFDVAGKALGVRVEVRAKSNCPGAEVPIIYRVSREYNDECERFHDGTDHVIAAVDPVLVVLVSSDFTPQVATPSGRLVTDYQDQLDRWADALRTQRRELAADGIELGVVLDNPRIQPDPLLCTEHDRTPERCGETLEEATRGVRAHIANERRVLGADASFETVPLVCADGRCPVEVDGLYAWADSSHLSADFTARHGKELAAFLRRFPALGGPAGA